MRSHFSPGWIVGLNGGRDDGRNDGRISGRDDGRGDGRISVRDDGHGDGLIVGRNDGRISVRDDGHGDGLIVGRNDGRISVRNDGRTGDRNDSLIGGRRAGRMSGRFACHIVFWALLLVLLAGCGGNTGGQPGARARGAAGVTELTVEGFEYGFDPDEIQINRGDTVRIVFRNTGILAHDWAIPDWNLRTPEIDGGQEATIEFTADKMGSFRFICTVPGHEALGMVGTLNVR